MPFDANLVPDHKIQKHGPPRLSGSVNSVRHKYDKTGKLVALPKKKVIVNPLEIEKVKAATALLPKPSSDTTTNAIDLSKFRPLLGRVLVKVGKPIEVVKGIVVPEKHRQSEENFEVIAIGGEAPFSVGEFVRFTKNSPYTDFRNGGQDYYVKYVSDVDAVVSPNTADQRRSPE